MSDKLYFPGRDDLPPEEPDFDFEDETESEEKKPQFTPAQRVLTFFGALISLLLITLIVVLVTGRAGKREIIFIGGDEYDPQIIETFENVPLGAKPESTTVRIEITTLAGVSRAAAPTTRAKSASTTKAKGKKATVQKIEPTQVIVTTTLPPVEEGVGIDEVDDMAAAEEGVGFEEAFGLVNLNTATLEELMTLDGIGEKLAKAILEYRDKYGYFSTVDEIMEIDGIGQGTFDKIKGRLTV